MQINEYERFWKHLIREGKEEREKKRNDLMQFFTILPVVKTHYKNHKNKNDN